MAHSLFKPKRKRNGKTQAGRYWWGQFRLPGDVKYTRFSLETTDKRVAEQRLTQRVLNEERLRAGILPPEAQTEAAAKPLAELLAEFVEYLRTGNRSRGYYRKVDQRVARLIDDCGWVRLRDVSAESFIQWRSRQTLTPKTLNDYHHAASSLLGWLKRTRRIDHNPLEFVDRVDGRGRKSFQRRALTDGEAERLLAVGGPRAIVYLTALHTGLRKGELRSLWWSDVDLDRALIRLRAVATKAKRADTLPLSPQLFAALRILRQSSSGTGVVFSGGVPSHHTFRTDLDAAKIARTGPEGKKVDFHALRTTFITNLQRAGVPQRMAMALARHTDPRLTAHVYTDTDALPLVEAVACLPTYGVSEAAHGTAQEDAQTADSGGLSVSHNGTVHEPGRDAQALPMEGLMGAVKRQGVMLRDTVKEWSQRNAS